MKIKSLFITTIILALSFFITGCNIEKAMPSVIPLEESVREIITSKGESYDFLEDELYNNKMEELINTISSKLKSTKIVYKLGNLDEDSVPELAVFIERNPDDINDQGLLQVYRFNGEKYDLIDQINMNYDNNNYQLEIGKISPDQNGLLIINQVGAHSGITYGYILKDNKLTSVLNDKKLNLLSIYTNNEIKDQDEDGILEFSIFTVDPETFEQSAVGSDKITYWYKWDGINGGILTSIERKAPNIKSNNELFNQLETLIDTDLILAYQTMLENQNQLSYIENTLLLSHYIDSLKESLIPMDIEIQRLFDNYQSNYLLNEYGLSIERLNELDYLKREKILINEVELKNYLIQNLELGYKLINSEILYRYTIDYSNIVQNFGELISKEYRDYLKVISLENIEPYLIGSNLMISPDKLMDRIDLIEQFRINYPYSDYLKEVESNYLLYCKYFIFGDIHNPTFDEKSYKIKEEVLNNWNIVIEKYPNSYFTDVLSKLSKDIKTNQNTLNKEIMDKYNYIY